ncbi:MAG: zinc ABC transporter substrate-binding protein [Pseudobutyrivibrio sp.]|nr:zinc ABC transporter substrate-binding protein [Pseudobutyrivibrio sp.]
MKNNSVKKKIFFVLLMLLGISLVAFGSTFIYVKYNNYNRVEASFHIVTSCNPVYIATLNICDDVEGVTVTNLSQPTTGCLHEYQLTTADMKVLSTADVLIINGGGMEGYLDDVMMSYPNLRIIDSSCGISEDMLIKEDKEHEHESEVMEEEEHEHKHEHELGGVNSHTWMSVSCYCAQADYIASELALIDSVHENFYLTNSMAYCDKIISELSAKIDEAKDMYEGQSAVILHEACEYVTYDLGVEVAGCMDLDEERQVSAGEVSELVDEMKEHGTTLIFAEEDYGTDMSKLLSKETGAEIIYIKTMIRGNYEKDSYIDIMKENYGISKNN